MPYTNGHDHQGQTRKGSTGPGSSVPDIDKTRQAIEQATRRSMLAVTNLHWGCREALALAPIDVRDQLIVQAALAYIFGSGLATPSDELLLAGKHFPEEIRDPYLADFLATVQEAFRRHNEPGDVVTLRATRRPTPSPIEVAASFPPVTTARGEDS